MEDDPAFNAGRGSKLTILGQVEMDAAVMDGKQMEAGYLLLTLNILKKQSLVFRRSSLPKGYQASD